MTDDTRQMYGGRSELAPYPLGMHSYGPERVSAALEWRGGQFPIPIFRSAFAVWGGVILAV